MTRDEDALRTAIEKATGRPLEPIPYFRLTEEQRQRHDEAEFRRVGTEPCKQCHPELHRSQCWEGGCVAATEFQPCAEAPIGVITNCAAMDCEGKGCAVAAAKNAPPVSLDDLTNKGI